MVAMLEVECCGGGGEGKEGEGDEVGGEEHHDIEYGWVGRLLRGYRVYCTARWVWSGGRGIPVLSQPREGGRKNRQALIAWVEAVWWS